MYLVADVPFGLLPLDGELAGEGNLVDSPLLDGPVHRLLQPLNFLLEKPNERTVSSCSRKSGKSQHSSILFSNSFEKIVFLRARGKGTVGMAAS